jgi:uncharacterized membrane protein YccC
MVKWVGMRNIKTAIAVTLCVLISQALKLEYPFYAAIAAVISMESSFVNSFRAGRNRMMGTLVGAGLGLIFASIQPNNALLCGVGTILLIYICNRFKWNSSISIAGIVFIAIMVNMNGKSPIEYSLNRILDTVIGISVALAVNYLLFPHYHAARTEQAHHSLADQTADILKRGVAGGEVVDLSGLEKHLAEAAESLSIHQADSRWSRGGRPLDADQVAADLEVYRTIYRHLAVIPWENAQRTLSPANAAALAQALGLPPANPEAGFEPCDEVNQVYNYHVGQVLHQWRTLREQWTLQK